MKRRNFIKGLIALAAAPLALREISATQELAPVSTISRCPEPKIDKSTIRKVEEMLTKKRVIPWVRQSSGYFVANLKSSKHPVYFYECYFVNAAGERVGEPTVQEVITA